MDLNGYEKETMNGGRGLEGAAEYNKCSVEREWMENQGYTLSENNPHSTHANLKKNRW